MSKLIAAVIVLALAAGIAWFAAGRAAGPVISISSPAKAIGQSGQLTLDIQTPAGKLRSLEVTLDQGSTHVPVFSFPGADASALTRSGDRLTLSRPLGKAQIPQLQSGQATIHVTAVRPVLFGVRQTTSTASHDFDVRLTPPTIAVLSTFHYINQGGSELVVYRVAPADATSGVRVGTHEYLGFPASGAHIPNADPGLRVAFFALLWDQDVATPISLFARDDVGNEGHATFDYRVIPKAFHHSTIQLDDRFLAKVVPWILEVSPQLKVQNPQDLIGSFLRINGDLRRMNSEEIASIARTTAPEMLWQGPFKQLVNTAVEGGFADQRTYIYQGKVVDHQVHLGFDLASTAGAAVLAANRGRVVHASPLGIYGNCIILDHGMGLQSLYAHLSAIEVKVGDLVNEGQRMGRTGSTGLAGGDHLHFTMLLDGNAVTPIDWWSAQWVQDRILRKLTEAGAPASAAATPAPAPAAAHGAHKRARRHH
jgi:murein DD-endopeptidase MepM/ murein hydrolase activator NlpD